MSAALPISGRAIRTIIVVWVLAVRYAPMRAIIQLPVNLQFMSSAKILINVIKRDYRSRAQLAERLHSRSEICILIFLNLFATAALALATVISEADILKVVVANDRPCAFEHVD